jgi:hypothetical protein
MQKCIFRIEREAASGQFQNYLKLSKGGLSLTCEVVADNRNFAKEGERWRDPCRTSTIRGSHCLTEAGMDLHEA